MVIMEEEGCGDKGTSWGWLGQVEWHGLNGIGWLSIMGRAVRVETGGTVANMSFVSVMASWLGPEAVAGARWGRVWNGMGLVSNVRTVVAAAMSEAVGSCVDGKSEVSCWWHFANGIGTSSSVALTGGVVESPVAELAMTSSILGCLTCNALDGS
jgi:hypothetical protein